MPSPRHSGHAPAELGLNSEALTPFARAKSWRIGCAMPV